MRIRNKGFKLYFRSNTLVLLAFEVLFLLGVFFTSFLVGGLFTDLDFTVFCFVRAIKVRYQEAYVFTSR